MVAITISELIPSSITEIDIDEMSSIQGGLLLSQELFIAVPDLDAVRVLIPTEELLESTESFSIGEIQNLFDFVSVAPAPIRIPTPRRIFNPRRFSF